MNEGMFFRLHFHNVTPHNTLPTYPDRFSSPTSFLSFSYFRWGSKEPARSEHHNDRAKVNCCCYGYQPGSSSTDAHCNFTLQKRTLIEGTSPYIHPHTRTELIVHMGSEAQLHINTDTHTYSLTILTHSHWPTMQHMHHAQQHCAISSFKNAHKVPMWYFLFLVKYICDPGPQKKS